MQGHTGGVDVQAQQASPAQAHHSACHAALLCQGSYSPGWGHWQLSMTLALTLHSGALPRHVALCFPLYFPQWQQSPRF